MKKEIPESYIKQSELLMQQERECSICGIQYKGARLICDSKLCWQEFDFRRKQNQYKYGPVNSYPSGAIFYWDYTYGSDGYKDTDSE